jgi:3-phenylpropionate/trans-cinnamate dioxygenase ferredoxin subunit
MSDQRFAFSEVLKDGELRALELNNLHLLVSRVAGQYFVTSNLCSHGRVLLSKGKLRGKHIICPLHGARFDVTTAQQAIKTYATETTDGKLTILLPKD